MAPISIDDKARLTRVFELAYEVLRRKINGGLIKVENEASLQLQLSAILKCVGELFEVDSSEHFWIELEKPILLTNALFGKSGSKKAKIDIWFAYKNTAGRVSGCAVELKYFRRENHREPNNRYDVFVDIKNLESYGGCADIGFMLVATDHDHYVSKAEYSKDTADFNFSHGAHYVAGRELSYRTATPYGDPISLSRSYQFTWDAVSGGISFMKVMVAPALAPDFVKVFADEPLQWGLRGDEHLWRDMAKALVGKGPFPESSARCRQVLESIFKELTGVEVSRQESVYLEKYTFGGMSSGYVDPSYWRERAIPLLLSRFEDLNETST